MKSAIKLALQAALVGNCLMTAAAGTYEGEYISIGYDQTFRDTSGDSYGKTMEVSILKNNLTISPSNTFTGTSEEQSLFRTVHNEVVMVDGKKMEHSRFAAGLQNYAGEAFSGGITPANDNKVLISEDGESFPVYFDRGTNVALTVFPTDGETEYDSIESSILIRKGSGMSNADLAGSYLRISLGNGVEDAADYGWGRTDQMSMDTVVMIFDGNGNYSESGTSWNVNRFINDKIMTYNTDPYSAIYATNDISEEALSGSGTYTLSESGALELITSDYGTIPCQLSVDTQVGVSGLAVSEPNDFYGTYFTTVVKIPDNMSTNFIEATYFITELTEELQKDSDEAGINNNYVGVSRIYVQLKADGTFTQRMDHWGLENTFINEAYLDGGSNLVFTTEFNTESNDKIIMFSSGSYSINRNGQVSLNFSNGDNGMAQLSENGEYLIFGFSDAEEEFAVRTAGIGIRRTPPAPAAGPVTFTGATMSSTGLVITATCPVNYPFEGLFSENLAEGEWYSAGVITSESGNLQFTEPGPPHSESGFYNATFAPW